jgi:hypothetical protein
MYKYFMSNISTFHVTALSVTKSVKITWILYIMYWCNSSQDFCHLKYVVYFSPYFTYVQCKWLWYIFNFNTSSVILLDIVNIHWHIFNLFSVV